MALFCPFKIKAWFSAIRCSISFSFFAGKTICPRNNRSLLLRMDLTSHFGTDYSLLQSQKVLLLAIGTTYAFAVHLQIRALHPLAARSHWFGSQSNSSPCLPLAIICDSCCFVSLWNFCWFSSSCNRSAGTTHDLSCPSALVFQVGRSTALASLTRHQHIKKQSPITGLDLLHLGGPKSLLKRAPVAPIACPREKFRHHGDWCCRALSAADTNSQINRGYFFYIVGNERQNWLAWRQLAEKAKPRTETSWTRSPLAIQ